MPSRNLQTRKLGFLNSFTNLPQKIIILVIKARLKACKTKASQATLAKHCGQISGILFYIVDLKCLNKYNHLKSNGIPLVLKLGRHISLNRRT